jgi:hypothetical protein
LCRMCRCEDVSATASVAAEIGFVGDGEASRTTLVENKSGVRCSAGSRPMETGHGHHDVKVTLYGQEKDGGFPIDAVSRSAGAAGF